MPSRKKKVTKLPTPAQSLCYHLARVSPMNKTQERVFDHWDDGQHLILHGSAGTGKTFISLYLALNSVLNQNHYGNITIIRSSVASRDLGFLPGSVEDKMEIFELPYKAIAIELFQRGDAYEILKKKRFIDFISTSFVRGLTLDNSVIIVDEIQNLSLHELDSIITRAGNNSRLIFCGDYTQSDLKNEKEKKGLVDFIELVGGLDEFSFVEFNRNDIVRSNLVKNYIIRKEELGIAA